MVYHARMSAAEAAVCSWWETTILPFAHRVCPPCSHFCDWILYTDAATSQPRIFALRVQGMVETPPLSAEHSMGADPARVYHFRTTCLISGLEFPESVAFLGDAAVNLAGRSIWFCMDSNNSLSATTRGDPNTATVAALISRAWELIRRCHIRAWFSRVRSKLNPADPPRAGRGCRLLRPGGAAFTRYRLYTGGAVVPNDCGARQLASVFHG